MYGDMMIVVIGIGIVLGGIGLGIVYQLSQIRIVLDRQRVHSTPAIEQPTTPTSWLATDALQAAQEQQQTKAAAKIANAVKWR